MNEFDVISAFFNCEQAPSDTLLVPNGDDCAVIATQNQLPLAVSVDTCIEGVHFPKKSAPKLIAKRALRTALSDLAAMGASPKWVTMALTLPGIEPKWLGAFSKSLHKDLAHFGCALIGGDTTKGDTLAITFNVMGECPAPITRSGAQVGDNIYVTNTIGNGAAALYFLQHQLDAHLYSDEDKSVLKSRAKYAKRHFYKPALTFDAAQALAGIATAAIDISDGLLADLTHICTKSGVRAQIDVNALPLSKYAKQLAKQKAENAFLSLPAWFDNSASDNGGVDDISDAEKTYLTWALTGGDDYELCFTASEQALQAIDPAIRACFTCIGTIDALTKDDDNHQPAVSLMLNGTHIDTALTGYCHF